PDLAAALGRSHRQRPFATGANFLPHRRPGHRVELVSLHLRRQYRSRNRNQPRLFHDAAHECSFRRLLSAGTPDPVAIRIGSARRARSFESYFRLWSLSLDRHLSLRHFRLLRLTAETIRYRRHPRLVYRNDSACSGRSRFSDLSSTVAYAHVRARRLIIVDFAH